MLRWLGRFLVLLYSDVQEQMLQLVATCGNQIGLKHEMQRVNRLKSGLKHLAINHGFAGESRIYRGFSLFFRESFHFDD